MNSDVGENQVCVVCCECVHVHAPQGAWRPTPTQSTCLYYCHGNEASKCVKAAAALQGFKPASGIVNRRTYLVRTGTYRVVLIYSTVPPCTALYRYVLFTPSTYQVRTIFPLYVPSTYLSKTVRTKYVLSTESMIKVRT